MLRAGDTVLGSLESDVLELLWKHGEADAKDVHAALGRARGITLNTVQSAMKRLFEKDLLRRRKVAHAHVYSARVTREQLSQTVLGDVVEKLLAGQPNAMMAAFVDMADRAGPDHLDALERMVAERRAERAKRGSR